LREGNSQAQEERRKEGIALARRNFSQLRSNFNGPDYPSLVVFSIFSK